MIVIELLGEPFGKQRPRLWRGKIYTPARTKSYERSLGWEAKIAMFGQKPMDGPLQVTVRAFMAKPMGKPDGDNILKAALDALNGIVWRDDCLVVDARIIKTFSSTPRLLIEVTCI